VVPIFNKLGIYRFKKLEFHKIELDISNKELLVVCMIAGIGFTVAMFVTQQAYPDIAIINAQAKMGAILSILFVFIAYIFAKIFKIEKINDEAEIKKIN
jgi:Na+/H+ antiporter NhaA